jgi:hypothetical protein
MGHKKKDLILKRMLKYAVLNKTTEEIIIYYYQKDVAKLFKVSRKTIFRNRTYENEQYKVYLITNVP